MPGYDPDVYVSQATPSIQHLQHQRINDVLKEVVSNTEVSEVQKEMDLMTEARIRFAKAALYEQMITGQLFEGEDPVTLEVENEFKEFAEKQLMVLLGISSNKVLKADPKNHFDDEQVEALRMLADKILKRQVNVTQATPPPQPQVGQLAPPKRGRGRPPGSTKKVETLPTPLPRQFSRPTTTQPTHPQQVVNENVKQDPQANVNTSSEKKSITLPNGQVKEVVVSKGQVRGSSVLPMPSPDEMIALAQAHGEMAYRNHGPLMSAKAELAEATIPRVVVNA